MPTTFPFSEKRIRKLKPPTDRDREYHKDRMYPGLQVCVTSAGTKTYYLVKRTDGRPTRHLLGTFEELSVKQARDAAAAKAGKIASGENPQAEPADPAERERRKPDLSGLLPKGPSSAPEGELTPEQANDVNRLVHTHARLVQAGIPTTSGKLQKDRHRWSDADSPDRQPRVPNPDFPHRYAEARHNAVLHGALVYNAQTNRFEPGPRYEEFAGIAPKRSRGWQASGPGSSPGMNDEQKQDRLEQWRQGTLAGLGESLPEDKWPKDFTKDLRESRVQQQMQGTNPPPELAGATVQDTADMLRILRRVEREGRLMGERASPGL